MPAPIEPRTRLARAARFQRALAAGESRPLWSPLLSIASALYGAGVRLSNLRFDRGLAVPAHVGARVICVGNLTTGGTGKTPVVARLATAALANGKRPAIVTRGYRRGGGAAQDSDEVRLFRRLAPEVPVIVDSDRVRGARAAVEGGADLVLLDDGFQHRRLHRDVDLVLVDALDPFGGDRLLPAGRLREPVDPALSRATAVIVTRCDRVAPEQLDSVIAQIARRRPGIPIWRERHVPVAVLDADGNSFGSPLRAAGQRVLVMTGIGDPSALAHTLESIGALPLKVLDFGDHHEFTREELRGVAAEAERATANVVMTTEKDLMRIGTWEGRVALRAVRVAAEFADGAEREEIGRVVGFRV